MFYFVAVSCRDITVPNADVSYDRTAVHGGYSVGTTVTVTCHSGYGMVVRFNTVHTIVISTCQPSGKWMNESEIQRCIGNKMNRVTFLQFLYQIMNFLVNHVQYKSCILI